MNHTPSIFSGGLRVYPWGSFAATTDVRFGVLPLPIVIFLVNHNPAVEPFKGYGHGVKITKKATVHYASPSLVS